MSFESILPSGVPSPVGPYSHAVTWHDLIFVSGQAPLDSGSGQRLAKDFEGQASQALRNLETVVTAAGGSSALILKTQIYLVDLAIFAAMNEVYAKLFPANISLRVPQSKRRRFLEASRLNSML